MHDLLARTKYSEFHGYSVCIEFGEAIGTMLENWCWIKDVLKSMSRHYTRINPKYREAWILAHPELPLPPEKIPDEVLDNLIEKRHKSRLKQHLGQL